MIVSQMFCHEGRACTHGLDDGRESEESIISLRIKDGYVLQDK
jgi:hypothetical protein